VQAGAILTDFIQPAPSFIMQVRSKASRGGIRGDQTLAPLKAAVHSVVFIVNLFNPVSKSLFKPVKISPQHDDELLAPSNVVLSGSFRFGSLNRKT
jgi:hypothetical protein